LGNVLVNQTQEIPLSQVTYIYYYGQAGINNTFDNYSAVSCSAYGGTGTNSFLGGTGSAYLYAGGFGSTNYLEAEAPGGIEVGGPGTNYLYPGTGILVIPGSGTDYIQ
jgi:Ca2+-binding RTX toxin-like protein